MAISWKKEGTMPYSYRITSIHNIYFWSRPARTVIIVLNLKIALMITDLHEQTISLNDNFVLSSLDEECVVTVHTDIVGWWERVCIAVEFEKKVFKHWTCQSAPILFWQIIHRNYTANVKILVDMFNRFHLSSNPQKVWYTLQAKQILTSYNWY